VPLGAAAGGGGGEWGWEVVERSSALAKLSIATDRHILPILSIRERADDDTRAIVTSLSQRRDAKRDQSVAFVVSRGSLAPNAAGVIKARHLISRELFGARERQRSVPCITFRHISNLMGGAARSQSRFRRARHSCADTIDTIVSIIDEIIAIVDSGAPGGTDRRIDY
jgi:hypothetical protein